MGRGEEKKSKSGLWVTIILIVVLIALAAVLIWILKDPRGFDRFKKKKKPGLKPTVERQQLHHPSDRTLALVDSGLQVVAELSWQRPVSPI